MYRILDTRGSGKTSRLMLLVKENNGILVCADPHSMRIKAHAYGLTGFDIISYSEFANKEYNTTKACYIDELESYMRFINQGTHIGGYTLSIE